MTLTPEAKHWKIFVFVATLLLLLVIGLVKSGRLSNLQGKFLGSTPTRADIMKMFVFDSRVTISTTSNLCIFTDITGSEWYAEYFYTACDNGWIASNPDGTITADASDYYTKAEVAKIAYLVYAVTPYSSSTASFADVASDTWYYDYIESLNAAGAFKNPSGNFKPDEKPSLSFMKYLIAHL